MDQRWRVARRGYAYVACSRFKTWRGCYLYGRLRVSDFLPVGEVRKDGRLCDDEVIARGYHFVSSDDSKGAGIEVAFAQRYCLAGGINDSESDGEAIHAPVAEEVDFDVDFGVGASGSHDVVMRESEGADARHDVDFL